MAILSSSVGSIELGWFNWSDIAYDDSTECFSTFANDHMPWIHKGLCIVSIVNAEQNPKWWFLAVMGMVVWLASYWQSSLSSLYDFYLHYL